MQFIAAKTLAVHLRLIHERHNQEPCPWNRTHNDIQNMGASRTTIHIKSRYSTLHETLQSLLKHNSDGFATFSTTTAPHQLLQYLLSFSSFFPLPHSNHSTHRPYHSTCTQSISVLSFRTKSLQPLRTERMSAIHTALIAPNERVIRKVPQSYPSTKHSLGPGDLAAVILGIALGLALLNLVIIRYRMGRNMINRGVIEWQGSAIPGPQRKSAD